MMSEAAMLNDFLLSWCEQEAKSFCLCVCRRLNHMAFSKGRKMMGLFFPVVILEANETPIKW